MSNGQQHDEIRRRVLDRMERSETMVKLAIVAAAIVEGACLILLLALIDFANRDQVIVLIAAVLVYMTIGLGLIALGAHVSRSTLRILQALDLAERTGPRA